VRTDIDSRAWEYQFMPAVSLKKMSAVSLKKDFSTCNYIT
jgi:hypothetical protein